jgi:hypothetical protein
MIDMRRNEAAEPAFHAWHSARTMGQPLFAIWDMHWLERVVVHALTNLLPIILRMVEYEKAMKFKLRAYS